MVDWKRVSINFSTVKLGHFIEPVKETVADKNDEGYKTVYGVSNIDGITITGKKASQNLSKYIIIDRNYFAYNPYRINVGSIGYNSNGIKGCVSPAYVVFKTKNNINPNFLYLYLKSEFGNHFINWYGNRGGVRNALRYDDLCNIDIPDIDLKKQNKLIQRLDKINVAYNLAVNENEKQINYLKELRKSILQDAIEGKLTEEWRKDNPQLISGENHASKLLEKVKTEKEKLIKGGKTKKEKSIPPISEYEKPYDIPEGWVWCRLGEVAQGFEYGTSTKSKKEGKVPVVRMGNIQNGYINYEDLVYTDNKVEIVKYLLKMNDLLFNRTNSRELVGKTAINMSNKKAVFAGYLIRFNMLGGINPYYSNYVMNSLLHRQWCNEVKADAIGQSNINATKLRGFRYPLPPLAEQNCIIEQIDNLMTIIEELEKQVSERKEQSEMLMRSVLREAFTI